MDDRPRHHPRLRTRHVLSRPGTHPPAVRHLPLESRRPTHPRTCRVGSVLRRLRRRLLRPGHRMGGVTRSHRRMHPRPTRRSRLAILPHPTGDERTDGHIPLPARRSRTQGPPRPLHRRQSRQRPRHRGGMAGRLPGHRRMRNRQVLPRPPGHPRRSRGHHPRSSHPPRHVGTRQQLLHAPTSRTAANRTLRGFGAVRRRGDRGLVRAGRVVDDRPRSDRWLRSPHVLSRPGTHPPAVRHLPLESRRSTHPRVLGLVGVLRRSRGRLLRPGDQLGSITGCHRGMHRGRTR